MELNIGIIGCGYWGKNLIRNFMEIQNCRLAAVADTDKKALQYIKLRHPSLIAYTDYKDLIASNIISAVVIAAPAQEHYRMAKEAMLAGKHVLVEKPLATSAREAQKLVLLARKKNKILMVDHTFLFTGAVRKMKEIIEAKELGRILYYDGVRINLGLFQKDVNVLWDLAPHDLSIMSFLLDKKPVQVSAIGVAHLKKGIENIAYMTLGFKDDLIAHFHFNWLAPAKVRLTLIGGSEKMIVYDDTEPSEKVKVYERRVKVMHSPEGEYKPNYDYRIGDMWAPKIDLAEALRYVCEEFISSINECRRPLSDGEFGLRIVKILEAAKKSIINNGKIVKL
ncbi:MAG: Gfo/Idh/MocA family oxidoreductase [Candidatus Omnitrophica bacterium]|nr:Gfo/Idh/MocA family oxidoreductase [Candidatus Omnitrophota bacterium]